MNKYAVIAIFAGTILLIVVLISSKTGSQQDQIVPTSSGKLEITEERFDFGTISMADGNVSYAFTVKNVGPEEVILSKLFTSCMCTKATLKIGDKKFGPFGMPSHVAIPTIRAILSPQETAEVEAVFDPNAHGPDATGPIKRVITITSNNGGSKGPQDIISFEGNVVK